MSKREEDKDGERKENLWDEILSEVSSQKIQEPKHLIVFGIFHILYSLSLFDYMLFKFEVLDEMIFDS